MLYYLPDILRYLKGISNIMWSKQNLWFLIFESILYSVFPLGEVNVKIYPFDQSNNAEIILLSPGSRSCQPASKLHPLLFHLTSRRESKLLSFLPYNIAKSNFTPSLFSFPFYSVLFLMSLSSLNYSLLFTTFGIKYKVFLKSVYNIPP